MTYRELQKALKELKAQGKTAIRLNSKKAVLQAEYDRLSSPTPIFQNDKTKVYRMEYKLDSGKSVFEEYTFTKGSNTAWVEDSDGSPYPLDAKTANRYCWQNIARGWQWVA